MSKHHVCPEFENHERWLISYADMLTLLFAVFVVLYAISISGKKKEDSSQAAGAMQEAFNQPLENIPTERRVAITKEGGLSILASIKGSKMRPSIVDRYPSNDQVVKIIEDEMQAIRIKLEQRLYGPEKFRKSEKAGEERIVSVQRTAKGFSLRLVARHFFEPGAVEIRRASRKDLDQIIVLLKDLGRPITIEGHTDSMPATGPMTNWEISTLRATSVLRYMISEHGFPATKLSAVGYADMKPIAHNGTAEGRALNRRVEIQVNYDSENTVDPK